MHLRSLSLVLIGIALTAPAHPATAGHYVFSSFDVPDSRQIYPAAINGAGVAVGSYQAQDLSNNGFVISQGVVTELKGGFNAYVALVGVNDRGIAVGSTPDGILVYHIHDGSSATLLPANASAVGVGINNHNDILAEIARGPLHSSSAPLVIAHGVRTLVLPPGRSSALPVAINDAGDVLGTLGPTSGSPAFVYRNGTFTTIPKPFGGVATPFRQSRVTGLTDSGAVFGFAFRNGYGTPKEIGFVYQGGSFDEVQYPGADYTEPAAVIGAGIVIGTYTTSQPSGEHGFVRFNGQYNRIDFPGGQLTRVAAANVDQTLLGSYYDAAYVQHLFIATCAPDQRPCTQ